MDAIKFVENYNRMCKSFSDNCEGCPANSGFCKINPPYECSAEEKVDIVEKWSNEHPIKTRQSVFLEQYPDASIGVDGALKICPAFISVSYRDSNGLCAGIDLECEVCRQQFWMQEVE